MEKKKESDMMACAKCKRLRHINYLKKDYDGIMVCVDGDENCNKIWLKRIYGRQ